MGKENVYCRLKEEYRWRQGHLGEPRADMILSPVKRRGRGRKGESRGTRYSSHEASKRELVTKMAELHREGHLGGGGTSYPLG